MSKFMEGVREFYNKTASGDYFVDYDTLEEAREFADKARKVLAEELSIDFFDTYKYITQNNTRVRIFDNSESSEKENIELVEEEVVNEQA